MTDPTQASAAQVAEALRADATRFANLSAAADLIRSGAGPELFRALIDQERHVQSEEDPIARLMRLFERIVAENAGVGAYLMGRLYGSSWRTKNHAVYDGIELWMHNLASTEAADALLQLSNEPIRPALKKICRSWEKLIRERS